MTQDTRPKEKNKPDNLSVIWDLLKSLVFFLGLYLFFLGWLYLYFYFNKFGIPPTSISIEFSSYYNYGFFALIQPTQLFLFIIFSFLIAVIYYKRDFLHYAYIIILAGMALFFTFSYFITKNNARDNAVSILKKRKKIDPIYFDFSSDFLASLYKDSAESALLHNDTILLTRAIPATKAVKLLEYNNSTQLYLIYENSDTYFVLYNPNKSGTLELDINIFDVSKKNINYATKIKSYQQDD